ncbi:MAG TPA: dephospho-CoA kinase, partial [Prolixibacteraceae bacterium]|nr:dephospho-CoA kinase [Prolixibacteraceae bacterium]
STVCRVFSILGIPVFEADVVAKQLQSTDEGIRAQLVALFGPAVYLPDRSVDRKYLASIVFNDPSLLLQLNAIIHPAVRKAFFEWCERQQSPYVLLEAAILYESGFYKMMDKVIVVSTDQEQRIERVMKREGTTLEQVLQRIGNQWTDEQRNKLADFVIHNNDDELIIPQIVEIDKKLRSNG